MDSNRRLNIALLITAVVLNVHTNEIEKKWDTCVQVEVSVDYEHYEHNRSVFTCEAPEKPLNGGYVSDIGGDRYNTGDTIQYYCYSGHQLIGQVNRTCNGSSEEWEPKQPYCEPQFVDRLMQSLNHIENEIRRLSGIEDRMTVIEQRFTTIENNTSQMSNVMDSRMSTIDNKVTAIDNTVSVMHNEVSTIDNNVSSIYDMLKMALLTLHVDTDRLLVCTGNTTATDEDTVTKCMTMQMGVRNGRSVSVYTWVIQDYKSKVPKSSRVIHYSQPFYHTVPGYKFRLSGYIYRKGYIEIRLQLLPGEYDDQLKWPFSQKYNVTVLTNTGLEAPYRTYSGEKSTCHLDRTTSPTYFSCDYLDAKWGDVLTNKKHILADDSVVVKLYFYN